MFYSKDDKVLDKTLMILVNTKNMKTAFCFGVKNIKQNAVLFVFMLAYVLYHASNNFMAQASLHP